MDSQMAAWVYSYLFYRRFTHCMKYWRRRNRRNGEFCVTVWPGIQMKSCNIGTCLLTLSVLETPVKMCTCAMNQ